jgi:hypothetical protein
VLSDLTFGRQKIQKKHIHNVIVEWIAIKIVRLSFVQA